MKSRRLVIASSPAHPSPFPGVPLSSTYRWLLRALALAVAVTGTAPLDPLAGQPVPTPQPSELVRFVSETHFGGDIVQGGLKEFGGDTLTILIGRQSWDLDVSDLQLEVYRVRTPRQGAVRGMKRGAVSGEGPKLWFATAAPSGQQELREPSERSPFLAGAMEFWIPFAGHAYAGDIKRGLFPTRSGSRAGFSSYATSTSASLAVAARPAPPRRSAF